MTFLIWPHQCCQLSVWQHCIFSNICGIIFKWSTSNLLNGFGQMIACVNFLTILIFSFNNQYLKVPLNFFIFMIHFPREPLVDVLPVNWPISQRRKNGRTKIERWESSCQSHNVHCTEQTISIRNNFH